jgi:hypothetical protein
VLIKRRKIMKNALRIGLLFLTLGALLPEASHAFIIFCDDICSCNNTCNINCYPDEGSPRTTCGAGGYDCISSPSCQSAVWTPAVPTSLPEFLAGLRTPASPAPAVAPQL